MVIAQNTYKLPDIVSVTELCSANNIIDYQLARKETWFALKVTQYI